MAMRLPQSRLPPKTSGRGMPEQGRQQPVPGAHQARREPRVRAVGPGAARRAAGSRRRSATAPRRARRRRRHRPSATLKARCAQLEALALGQQRAAGAALRIAVRWTSSGPLTPASAIHQAPAASRRRRIREPSAGRQAEGGAVERHLLAGIEGNRDLRRHPGGRRAQQAGQLQGAQQQEQGGAEQASGTEMQAQRRLAVPRGRTWPDGGARRRSRALRSERSGTGGTAGRARTADQAADLEGVAGAPFRARRQQRAQQAQGGVARRGRRRAGAGNGEAWRRNSAASSGARMAGRPPRGRRAGPPRRRCRARARRRAGAAEAQHGAGNDMVEQGAEGEVIAAGVGEVAPPASGKNCSGACQLAVPV
jgi:hypothetical protein